MLLRLSRNDMFFFHPDFVLLHVTVGLGIAPSRHLHKVNFIDGTLGWLKASFGDVRGLRGYVCLSPPVGIFTLPWSTI